jgi:hypothetical protein
MCHLCVYICNVSSISIDCKKGSVIIHSSSFFLMKPLRKHTSLLRLLFNNSVVASYLFSLSCLFHAEIGVIEKHYVSFPQTLRLHRMKVSIA